MKEPKTAAPAERRGEIPLGGNLKLLSRLSDLLAKHKKSRSMVHSVLDTISHSSQPIVLHGQQTGLRAQRYHLYMGGFLPACHHLRVTLLLAMMKVPGGSGNEKSKARTG